MTHSSLAARSHVRNVLLCVLATLTLAACGDDDGTGSSAASTSAVSTSVGLINRTPATATDETTSPASATSTASTTTTTSTSSTATTSGTATLDWAPPTENTDGSALTNLAGYNVYYGTSPTNLTQSVKLTNPGLSTYTVTNLTSGTWYFSVTSVSAAGVESSRTGVVSTTI